MSMYIYDGFLRDVVQEDHGTVAVGTQQGPRLRRASPSTRVPHLAPTPVLGLGLAARMRTTTRMRTQMSA